MRVCFSLQKARSPFKRRRLWAWTSLFTFLILLFLLDFTLILRSSTLRYHTSKIFKTLFKTKIRYETIRFSPLATQLDFKDLQIWANPKVESPFLLSAGNLSVSLNLAQQGVKEITLSRGVIHLEHRKGKWNFEDILVPSKEKTQTAPQEIILNQVEIHLAGISKDPFKFFVVRGRLIPPSRKSPLKIRGFLRDKSGDFESLFFQVEGREILQCSLSLDKLSLSSDFQKKLPEVVRKTLSHFSPRGKTDVVLNFSLNTKTFEVTRVGGFLRIYNLSFRLEELSQAVTYITGEIDFRGQNLYIKNLQGYCGEALITAEGKLFDFGRKGGEVVVTVDNLRATKEFLSLVPDKDVRNIIWLFHPEGWGDVKFLVLADPPHDLGIKVHIQLKKTRAWFRSVPYPLEDVEGDLNIVNTHVLPFTSKRYRFDLPKEGGQFGLFVQEIMNHSYPKGTVVSLFLKGRRGSGSVRIWGNVLALESPRKKKKGNGKKGELKNKEKVAQPGVDLTFQARHIALDEALNKAFAFLEPARWVAKTFSPKGFLDGWVRVLMPPQAGDIIFPTVRLFPKEASVVFDQIPLPINQINSGEIYVDSDRVKLKKLEGKYKEATIQLTGQVEIPFVVSVALKNQQFFNRGIIPSETRKRLAVKNIFLSPRARVEVVKKDQTWLLREGTKKWMVKKTKKVLDVSRFPQEKDWFTISIQNLTVSEAVLKALEKGMPDLVKKLRSFHLRGKLSLEIYLEPEGPYQKEFTKARVQLHKIQAKIEGVPFEELTGNLRFIQDQVHLDFLIGKCQEARAIVQGKIDNLFGAAPQADIKVSLYGLSLESWMIPLLPPQGQSFWKKLKLQGNLKEVHIKIASRPSPKDSKKTEFYAGSLQIQVGPISFQISPLPPLTCTGGSLSHEKDSLTVEKLEGSWGKGKWTASLSSRGEEQEGKINFENFSFEEKDWRSLPQILKRFGWKGEDFTQKFNFAGELNFQVTWKKEKKSPLEWEVAGYPRGLYSQMAFIPLPTYWDKGFFLYKSSSKILSLANLKGRYRKSPLSLYGTVTIGEQIESTITLNLQKTPWTTDLINGLPGPLKKVLTKITPQGKFSLALHVEKKALLPFFFLNGIVTLHKTTMKLALEAKDWEGQVHFLGRVMDEPEKEKETGKNPPREDRNKIEGFIRLKKGLYAGQPLENIQSYFIFRKNLFLLPNISGKLYEGEFKGFFSLSVEDPLPYRGEFALQKGRVKSFSAANFSPSQRPGQPLKGEIKAYLKIYGNAVAPSTLKGNGWVLIDQARLFKLPYFLEGLLKAISLRFLKFSRKPVFQKAWLKFDIQDEALHFEPKGIVLESSDLTLLARGKIDFEKNLDLRFSWVVGPSIQGLDPILEFFKEELFFSIEVKGPSKKPLIRVQALKVLTNPLGK